MEATDPFWRSSEVRQAVAAGHFGALIRMARAVQRLSLAQVGTMMSYPVSTLSRIENGHRQFASVAELRSFATVLGIPHHLFGLAPSDGAAPAASTCDPTTVGACTGEGGDSAMQRRRMLAGLVAITGTALLGSSGQPPGVRAATSADRLQTLLSSGAERVPQPVAVLRSHLATARQMFQACHYDDLAAVLPDYIATMQASVDAADGCRREHSAALLADGYSLASDLCTRLPSDSLAWVMAERARSAAELSGHPASIAEAARMTAIAMRRHGFHDTATALLTTTAVGLGAGAGAPEPEVLATYGSLLCTAAYTAAQSGRRHQALELMDEASAAAGRLGDTRTPGTEFGSTNVAIYQIGVHNALGDAGAALQYARAVQTHTLSTERMARYCVDTGRAWLRFGNRVRCLDALLAAERCAPEEIRRTSVRQLVRSMVEDSGPKPAGLREFVHRCGSPA